MPIRPLEKTNCYKCAVVILAPQGDVHSLCAECQDDFDDWFASQLSMFGDK